MLYLVAVSLLLGSALIGLLAAAAGNTAFFAGNIQLLLWVTVAAGAGLAALIFYQAFLLVRRIRAGVFGAKLTARLFLIIGLMSLAPGLVVYGVSVQFLIRSIESWFDVRMENALEGGLALGQSALDHVQQEAAKKTEHLAQQLGDLPPILQAARLDDLREAAGVQELGLFDINGNLLGFSSSDRSSTLPRPPEHASIWQARLQKTWSRLQATDSGGIMVRVVAPVNMASLSERPRVVQVLQPVPRQLARDAQQVEEARQGYQELLVSRLGLKRLYGIFPHPGPGPGAVFRLLAGFFALRTTRRSLARPGAWHARGGARGFYRGADGIESRRTGHAYALIQPHDPAAF